MAPGQAMCPSCRRRRKASPVYLESCPPSSERVTVASVADADDTVTAMIYRHVEPLVADAGLFVLIISIDGDVEGDAAAYLDHALQRAVLDGAPVCCDLSSARFFGAAGATVVLTAAERAADVGTLLLLRGVHGLTGRVLDAVGFERGLIIE